MTKGTSLTLDQTCHVLFQLLAHQPTKGRAILKGLEAIEVLVKVVMKAEGIPQSRFPDSLFRKIHDLRVWAGK